MDSVFDANFSVVICLVVHIDLMIVLWYEGDSWNGVNLKKKHDRQCFYMSRFDHNCNHMIIQFPV